MTVNNVLGVWSENGVKHPKRNSHNAARVFFSEILPQQNLVASNCVNSLTVSMVSLSVLQSLSSLANKSSFTATDKVLLETNLKSLNSSSLELSETLASHLAAVLYVSSKQLSQKTLPSSSYLSSPPFPLTAYQYN
ncbi:hypothetical protein GEMRC1_012590 [Eukaryota sp. GEM-RC1]